MNNSQYTDKNHGHSDIYILFDRYIWVGVDSRAVREEILIGYNQ